MAQASRDDNFVTTLLAVSSVDGVTPVTLYANPTTHRLLVDLAGGGSGTVQTVAVATANGFAGTSDGNASAPTLTLTTSITGILKGNGTAISAITVGSGLSYDGTTLSASGGGSGTVTDVSVVTANGVSGSVATSTTTPAITLTLGAITPSGVQVSGLTASEIVINDASKNLTSAAVATYPSLTELTYLKGVTSAIQTQFSGKVTGPASATDTAVAIYDGTTGKLIKNQTNILIDSNGRIRLGGTDGSALIDIKTATSVIQGLRIEGDATSAIAFSTFVTADSFLRFSFLSSGMLTWGSGSGAGDTNLYRSGANALKTDDALEVTGVLTTGSTIELGNASDTTLSRVSAGVAAIEGNNIVVNTSSPTLATITTTGNIELGNASDTTLSRSAAGVIAVEGVVIPSISSTNTLTNKRITKRTGTTTSSATPTLNTDNVDEYYITAQTVDITSFTTNLSGTPTLGQMLYISVIGTAARAITWGASFGNGPVALPTTTVTTTELSVLFKYDGSVWRCFASGSRA